MPLQDPPLQQQQQQQQQPAVATAASASSGSVVWFSLQFFCRSSCLILCLIHCLLFAVCYCLLLLHCISSSTLPAFLYILSPAPSVIDIIAGIISLLMSRQPTLPSTLHTPCVAVLQHCWENAKILPHPRTDSIIASEHSNAQQRVANSTGKADKDER